MISRYISVSTSSQFILVFLVSCRLDLLFVGCLWHLYCCFLVFWRDPFHVGVLWLLFLLATLVFIFVSHGRNMIVLPKYQPKRGGDLGWDKLFRFKCGIKNYLQIANVDLANVWSQFNCNIDIDGEIWIKSKKKPIV